MTLIGNEYHSGQQLGDAFQAQVGEGKNAGKLCIDQFKWDFRGYNNTIL